MRLAVTYHYLLYFRVGSPASLLVSAYVRFHGRVVRLDNRECTRLSGHNRIEIDQRFATSNEFLTRSQERHIGCYVLERAVRNVLHTTLDFDVPVLGEIAKAVSDLMAGQDSFELTELMGALESTQAAAVAVQLADDGAKKGNFCQCLEDAVDDFINHLEYQHRNQIKAGLKDDDTESIRKIDESIRTKKVNTRTPGIIA